MKTKSFKIYLEKRLNREEIADIEKRAATEVAILQALQQGVIEAVDSYMKEHDIGFNELVRRLDSSATQVAKIKRGEANLTLSSLAHIFSLLGKEPQIVFKSNKKS